jgi:hypothetical protein
MALTPANFKIRYPEFVAVDDSRIQFWMNDAVFEVGEAAWGTLYEKGVMLLTAHLLFVDQENQGTGSGSGGSSMSRTTMRKVGDVSESFARAAADNATDDWYLQSTYGSEYLRLKRRKGMGAIAVGAIAVGGV